MGVRFYDVSTAGISKTLSFVPIASVLLRQIRRGLHRGLERHPEARSWQLATDTSGFRIC